MYENISVIFRENDCRIIHRGLECCICPLHLSLQPQGRLTLSQQKALSSSSSCVYPVSGYKENSSSIKTDVSYLPWKTIALEEWPHSRDFFETCQGPKAPHSCPTACRGLIRAVFPKKQVRRHFLTTAIMLSRIFLFESNSGTFSCMCATTLSALRGKKGEK